MTPTPCPLRADGGERRRLRLHPAGRQLDDQQHRVPGRPGRRQRDRRLFDRAADPRVHRHHPRSHAGARAHPGQHHHHPDHTAGNGLFSGATIVAHELARPEMRTLGLPHNSGVWTDVDCGDLELGLPFLTFADRLTLWADELRCDLRYAGGPAHTTNDVVAWIPERSVLFAGDLLFNGGTPFLLSGSVLGAIEVLEGFVRPLGAQTIVPGHGPVAGPELVDEVLGYLRFVRDVAQEGRAAGVSALELARGTDLGAYAEWTDAERIVGNLHRAYADLDVPAEARGRPIDFPGALADMVAFNGGRPLTGLA